MLKAQHDADTILNHDQRADAINASTLHDLWSQIDGREVANQVKRKTQALGM